MKESNSQDFLVSVLIVNFNYERFISEAIDSVLRQTYQRFELIICDDGSTDGSRKIILQYAERDSRVRPIFKENAAVAAALNDSFAASSGEIIVLLDADDYFTPDKLEKVFACFQRSPEIGMVMNNCRKVDVNGALVGRIPQFGSFHGGEIREQLLNTGGFWVAAPTSALAMKRECASRVFPIPPADFKTEADAYMRSVAAIFYPVGILNEELTIYRVHSSNVTASSTVDLRWCDKAISAAQRVHVVLTKLAEANGWHLYPLRYNPSYCEMTLVRDILTNVRLRLRLIHFVQLVRITLAVKGGDWMKQLAKSLLLGVSTILPHRMRLYVLRSIYLPSSFKRQASLLGR